MIVAVIQARMNSTRLPGKVLMPIAGRPMLWHLWNRLMSSGTIDRVVVATSELSSNDPIHEFCKKKDILCFRAVWRILWQLRLVLHLSFLFPLSHSQNLGLLCIAGCVGFLEE